MNKIKTIINAHEIAGRLPTFKPQLRAKVRAGEKLQTRRAMKQHPNGEVTRCWNVEDNIWAMYVAEATCARTLIFKSPYGKPGDIRVMTEPLESAMGVARYADDKKMVLMPSEIRCQENNLEWRWQRDTLTSMYMPTEAGRTLVEIKRVWVERLQDITQPDIVAEGAGIGDAKMTPGDHIGWVGAHRAAFSSLWDSINAKPKPSNRNPYTGAPEKCYVSYPWSDMQEIWEHRGLKLYVIGNPWNWAIAWELLK